MMSKHKSMLVNPRDILLVLSILISIPTAAADPEHLRNPSGDMGCTRLARIDYTRDCAAVDNLASLQRMQTGECVIMRVNAKSRWNASGLMLERGAAYHISELDTPENCWQDASIVAKGEGWKNGGDVYLACDSDKKVQLKKKWTIGALEWLRRYPEADWFTLIGMTGKAGCCTSEKEFIIGRETDFIPEQNAEFCAYANDLNFMYWNNSGELTIKIERTH